MDRQQHDRKEERSANSGFAKKRVQWLMEHAASHQILWYVESFVLRNPLLLQAAKKHCASAYGYTHKKIKYQLILR
jgi:hypothetical protein